MILVKIGTVIIASPFEKTDAKVYTVAAFTPMGTFFILSNILFILILYLYISLKIKMLNNMSRVPYCN